MRMNVRFRIPDSAPWICDSNGLQATGYPAVHQSRNSQASQDTADGQIYLAKRYPWRLQLKTLEERALEERVP